jgi:amino acid transporter
LAVNALGIDRVGKFGVIGVAGELVAVGVIVTLTMILGAHQSPSILVHLPQGQTFGDWLPGFLGAAAFMPIWALYTFEGAGLLGEETRDARNGAPKAILISFAATVGVAMYIILVFILTSKNPTAAMSAANPIADNINNALPNWCSKVYEFVVLEVLFLAASAVLTYASRQMYGMARAKELPISGTLTKSLDNGVPIGSLIAVSILSGLPLLISSSIAVLIGGTSALMYVVYALMILLVVISRFRGWPSRPAPFSLGRYGMFVSIAALAVTVAIGTDLLWPRDSTNPAWHLGIRAAYWMVGIPLLAGLILMFARPKTAVHVPDPVDALERATPEEGLASGA